MRQVASALPAIAETDRAAPQRKLCFSTAPAEAVELKFFRAVRPRRLSFSFG
jgi:hypothetical protein